MTGPGSDRNNETEPETTPGPVWKRLVWFIAIWAMSVAALGALAYIIRLWLK